jgi:chemotaxis protein methyltransferase CheR
VGNDRASKEFMMMQRFIEDRCGISIGDEKAYLLESRLARMLAESVFESFEELYVQICNCNDPDTIDDIIDSITVNETFWFRDKTPWLIMEELLLPAYIMELREGKRNRVRIWSAASSYGQEPYSIAMCIDHYLVSHGVRDFTLDHFEICATDISHTVIQMAKTGRYDNISIQRGLEDNYRSAYFKNEGRIWTLNEKIRNAVRFQQFNLINEFFSFGKFDIIFFRNVLIYFSDKLKKEMMVKIKTSLYPGGALFIGNSELFTDYDTNYIAVQHRNGIYFRVKG